MSNPAEPETTKIEVQEVSLEVANERKQEGNDLFRAGKWNDAVVAYRSALGCLPKRPPGAKGATEEGVPPMPESEHVSDSEGEDEESVKEKGKKEEEEEVVEVSTPAVDEDEKEMRQLRAVLNANIGACFLKLGENKEAVEVCTQALLDDPGYVKALERRASCNDALNTWTSLSSAQEDYTKLITLDRSPAQQTDTRRKLNALKPRLEAAQKKETDEMLGKLKGLGDSLLGNFGLSTDNFKMVPNGQGGYSLNFSR